MAWNKYIKAQELYDVTCGETEQPVSDVTAGPSLFPADGKHLL